MAIAVMDAETVVPILMRWAKRRPTVTARFYTFQSCKQVGHGRDLPRSPCSMIALERFSSSFSLALGCKLLSFTAADISAGQVYELLDILTGLASFEGRVLRPTIVSYS
jgi:hypothetical protein